MNVIPFFSERQWLTIRKLANGVGWQVLLAIITLWLGPLLGVSFLATPAKLLAPSLSLPAALDVGRHTFAPFNKMEWLLAAVLLVTLLNGAPTRLSILASVVAWLVVVAETVGLLPLLDQRVELIIAGQHHAAVVLLAQCDRETAE